MSGGLGSRTTAPQPFLEDADFTLYNGNVLDVLPMLPADSVHCVVTSPPYWGLRDYGATGQLGLEPTPDAYLENMVGVFREVRRVLRSDGTCWVNMGDSYASGGGSGQQGKDGQMADRSVVVGGRGFRPGNPDKNGGQSNRDGVYAPGLKPKDLCMIPARLALALQQDGWWLRSQVVWAKPNPMPESVTDRPTTSHEFVYLLAKSPRYFFDQEAVREPLLSPLHAPGNKTKFGEVQRNDFGTDRMAATWGSESGRNLRSVWEIATQPYPEAHFATYPEELVRRCILAGTSERGCCPECGAPWERELEQVGERQDRWTETSAHATSESVPDGIHRERTMTRVMSTVGWHGSCYHNRNPVPCVVLDPFCGSGTTALVARKHGRRIIGIELSREYCDLAARRTQQLRLEPA